MDFSGINFITPMPICFDPGPCGELVYSSSTVMESLQQPNSVCWPLLAYDHSGPEQHYLISLLNHQQHLCGVSGVHRMVRILIQRLLALQILGLRFSSSLLALSCRAG